MDWSWSQSSEKKVENCKEMKNFYQFHHLIQYPNNCFASLQLSHPIGEGIKYTLFWVIGFISLSVWSQSQSQTESESLLFPSKRGCHSKSVWKKISETLLMKVILVSEKQYSLTLRSDKMSDENFCSLSANDFNLGAIWVLTVLQNKNKIIDSIHETETNISSVDLNLKNKFYERNVLWIECRL